MLSGSVSSYSPLLPAAAADEDEDDDDDDPVVSRVSHHSPFSSLDTKVTAQFIH